MHSNNTSESFAPMSVSMLDRDEQSFMMKRNIQHKDVTLQGQTSNISWQLSGDISLFQTGPASSSHGTGLDKSIHRRERQPETRSVTTDIEQRLKYEYIASPMKFMEEVISHLDNNALQQLSKADSRVTCSNESSFRALGYSMIDRDEQSILRKGYIRSHDVSFQGIERSDISWRLDPSEITLYKSQDKAKALVNHDATRDNTLALMEKIRNMPAGVSATEIVDLLLSPSGREKSIRRLERLPETESKIMSSEVIKQRLKDGVGPIKLYEEMVSRTGIGKAESRVTCPNESSFRALEYSIIDRDESSILKKEYIRSQDQGIECSDISWGLDSSEIASHPKDEASDIHNATIDNTLALMEKIRNMPADMSGTEMADLLVPPSDGVSTKERMERNALNSDITISELFSRINEGYPARRLIDQLIPHPGKADY